MGKLVLIDGNSIANRAFYALPLLTNKEGLYTNAVYGFAQIIIKIVKEIKPDYMLVAFDAGKVTFRHTDYQDYKGKRKKTPSELSSQFPMLKKLLDALQIKHFELEEYEADDIIGTISKSAEIREIETIIYTGDKDMLQLASDKVSIFLTRRGITEVDIFGPKEIMDKYQLTPKQIIDLKGLMGDTSDNIPGVPGVGEKTAIKLLHQFETVEGVLENIEKVSGKKLKEKLAENKEQALLSKKLATIFKEVPIGFEIDDLKVKEPDLEEVKQLFINWEFNTLIERLGIESTENNLEKDYEKIDYQTYSKEIKSVWNEKFHKKEQIALHVETNYEKTHDKEIYGLALSDGEEQVYLTLEEMIAWTELKEWLSDPTAPKWVYDGKRIEMVLYWNNFKLNGVTADLLLSNYILNPADGGNDLAKIAKEHGYNDLQADDIIYGKGAKKVIPDPEVIMEHISSKAYIIYSLVPMLNNKIVENKMEKLLYDIELPLSRVLAKMEKNGVLIDVNRLEQMGDEFNQKLKGLTDEIYELAGREFNINSPKQLGEILFDKLQLPVIKKTKTGYSTSADVLEKLEPYHPIIGKILHYRQLGKLYSTYVEGLLKVVDPETHKIHTSFNQAVTATGRLSSTDPNLQNIPIRLEEGRKIRQAFIPSESEWLILSADYSQIELRVLAHISEDENLIQAFIDDLDIHTKTAMDVFNVSEHEVTSLMRRQAKAVNFGIVYGISDYGLSQNLNISRKEAGEFIDKYFSVFSGVKNYMTEIIKQAKKKGYVSTLLNRRRYLPDINSSNYNIRSFAERTAMNTPIQGTAADIIKIAMVRIANKIEDRNLNSRLLLQVHDELIFEVDPIEIDLMKTLVKETMEEAMDLKVPLKVDINIGKTWYEAK
ncbi:DNA polymerase I [Vulcanibacillus modesticaldus]|uniref:DNA polymerase I n=1 Tax=Vulcanibacillus modesticaldus TaxID=337097 RepID=A0A1D2YWL4_9BACI|nr:DNA polymerase I [Vulcanibacillus modesticaldus]OEG00094.1 DNA polymerase I [Vulcanibacillus modesticaldus]